MLAGLGVSMLDFGLVSFKAFVFGIGEKVANASGSGFLGFGEKVSDAERDYLARLRSHLGI